MQFAIVYDSRTGRTKKCAEAMGRIVEAAGNDAYVASVDDAKTDKVRNADVICIGSWTQGLFFVLQHPTRRVLEFIDQLGVLRRQHAAVFCTYRTSYGPLLDMLADRLAPHGVAVTGKFGTRHADAPEGFAAWVSDLTPAPEQDESESGDADADADAESAEAA